MKLFLIDGHALIFKMYYAFLGRPMINAKGVDTSILFGFTKYLLELIRREQPTHIAVGFDPPGGSFRNQLYPEYKANRGETPQLVIDALEPLTQIVKSLNIPVLMIPGFEADDVLGSMAKRSAREGFDVYMVTPDKDYGQLLEPHIFQVKPGKKGGDDELFDIPRLQEKYGISRPDQIIDMLAICGDASDNVPGVKGVGEVGASKLLQQYDTLEGIYEHLGELTARQQELFRAAEDHIALSKTLVTIKTDIPIDTSADDMALRPAGPSAIELFNLYGFNSLKKYLAVGEMSSGEGIPPEGRNTRCSFVYDVTAGGVQNIESVAVGTGRLIALTGTNGAVSFESDGFITDHLGNVAVVVNLSASGGTQTDNVILEQNEYTPFGTKLGVSGLKSQAANRWRYAGKEEQDIAGMNLRLLDFGARYYDSFTCRWNAVDPLAGKYPGLSPYNYCAGDPVNLTDPTGRSIGDFFNLWGKLIGSDGKDDGKKYLVLDNEEAKAVKTNTKNGTPTSKSNVPSAIEVPSNEVIDKCDEALKASDVNEHGLVVATDGTTSSMIEGDPRSVVLGPGYEELDAQGKETSHDVHVHPYSLKLLGNDKYEGSSSKPSRADRTYRRVKEENGAVNQPSWVIATVPTNVTADGNAEKTVKITIYDSSSDDGIATADWNQFKRAAKKLNK
ncbi:MAG: hypothetical protein IKZ72_05905, partial [Bacteroidales bacterium]|nr:hypothetical protein [Bacteroidales bacterium]